MKCRPEIDALVEIARSIGLKGRDWSRITGGGFGAAPLRRQDRQQTIAKKIADGKAKIGKDATIFVTRPAQGAGP